MMDRMERKLKKNFEKHAVPAVRVIKNLQSLPLDAKVVIGTFERWDSSNQRLGSLYTNGEYIRTFSDGEKFFIVGTIDLLKGD